MFMEKERQDVWKYCKLLQSRHLIQGTSGNISVLNRELGLVAISSSAVPYETMQPEDVAIIDLKGRHVEGPYKASSEWLMHLGCYRSRTDVNAVVHAHSKYAVIVACMGKEIPLFYCLHAASGNATRCLPYYAFGTPELADAVEKNLEQDSALLLGNHGQLTVGATLEKAFSAAELTEFAAELYINILQAGEPKLLTESEVEASRAQLKKYKKQEVSSNGND